MRWKEVELGESGLEEAVGAARSYFAVVSVGPSIDADDVNRLGAKGAEGYVDPTALDRFLVGVIARLEVPSGAGASHKGSDSSGWLGVLRTRVRDVAVPP